VQIQVHYITDKHKVKGWRKKHNKAEKLTNEKSVDKNYVTQNVRIVKDGDDNDDDDDDDNSCSFTCKLDN
jgi:hypothetical protein